MLPSWVKLSTSPSASLFNVMDVSLDALVLNLVLPSVDGEAQCIRFRTTGAKRYHVILILKGTWYLFAPMGRFFVFRGFRRGRGNHF
ncbi:hypothetical protein DPMN_118226 [Dreissena polymorpha]|uniref:Uncharacterized protein n=1 Tax=Dreissena polymorpha TaxID=45954 RepID=A0A9D4GKD7_DREPO|nr:hypothetical protein DPMN_118226 [Dreissena polymorpha]